MATVTTGKGARKRSRITEDDALVWGGVALVLVCPLIGLAIGVVFWGWPQ